MGTGRGIKLSRESCIKIIESLYPPDSPSRRTSEIGQRLLIEAISVHWRQMLSDAVLLTLSRLNQVEEKLQDKKMF